MSLEILPFSGLAAGPRDSRLERMIAQFNSEADMNYNIFIAEDFKFIYFTNPICACSTIKWTLNAAVAKARGVDYEVSDLKHVHGRQFGPMKNAKQFGYDAFLDALEDPGWKKFSFIRSPEGRLLSAHSKKLRRPTQFVEAVRTHLGVAQDTPLDEFLTLSQFAKGVARDHKLRDLDGHWRLQRKQILFDFVPGYQIGFVESFKEDAPVLFDQIFGADDYEIADVAALHPQNASSRKRGNKPALSDLDKAYVREAYQSDFDLIEQVKAAREGSQA